MNAESIGRVIGALLFLFLVMALIGLINYLRYRDTARAKRAARSWWSIVIAVVLLAGGLLGQVANQIS